LVAIVHRYLINDVSNGSCIELFAVGYWKFFDVVYRYIYDGLLDIILPNT